MKKLLFIFPLFLFAKDSILSNLQLKKLNLDKKYTIEDSKETKKSWINPVMLQYSISKNNSLHTIKTTNQNFSITLNQPIFKSGAIYYSIKYANDNKNYNIKELELRKKELIKEALDLAIDYKINRLNEELLKLNIANAKIDVKNKKEQYQNGTLDLSFLNNAIIYLNSLKLSMQDLEINAINLKYAFKNISDMNIKNVNINLFKIISLNKYIQNNIELNALKKQSKVNNDLYKMQLGNTLFTVFVNASYNYQKTMYSKNTFQFQNNTNNFYSVGMGISFPLDFTAGEKIQKAKINYLNSKLDILQKKRELKNSFTNTLKQIKYIQNKIKIYQQNIKLYNELIATTKDSIKAGNATIDDLETLENTKKTNGINIAILKLQIQKLLLNLYYKTTLFSN